MITQHDTFANLRIAPVYQSDPMKYWTQVPIFLRVWTEIRLKMNSLAPRPDFQFEPLLSDKQAARLLGGIHPKTVQRMARNGQIPAYRVGRFWRYRASELSDWLRLQSSSRTARAKVTVI
jgi:excisionase family DNA binding protein